MSLSITTYLIVCPLIFLAGLVDSVAGGGGLISLPAYLAAGLPAHMAAGTNKLSACIGCTAATVRYSLGGKLRWRVGILAALGALPGSWLGATLQQHIPAQTVRVMMLVILPIVAVVVLSERNGLKSVQRVPDRALLPVAFAIGLVIGFYDGLVGPGTGTFLILLFTLLLGLDGVSASGTAKLVNWASNVAALVSYFSTGNILVALALPAALCSVAGNLVGANLTLHRGTGLIRWMMLLVLALLLIRVAFEL